MTLRSSGIAGKTKIAEKFRIESEPPSVMWHVELSEDYSSAPGLKNPAIKL